MIRVVFNQKGGVGKSSIAANLAAISARRDKKTLIVDIDPQCNASHYLLGDRFKPTDLSVADFFKQHLGFKLGSSPYAVNDYVTASAYKNLYIIQSSPELADIQSKLESKYKIYKLRDALRELSKSFDAIYIDTPPAFNIYTLSALIAAHSCLIPFDCDAFSRSALYALMENLEETRGDHNEGLRVEGIVVNQYMPRASQPTRIVAELIEEGLPVFNAKLSSSVKMRESHERSIPLIHFAPNHKLTQEYVALFDELNAA